MNLTRLPYLWNNKNYTKTFFTPNLFLLFIGTTQMTQVLNDSTVRDILMSLKLVYMLWYFMNYFPLPISLLQHFTQEEGENWTPKNQKNFQDSFFTCCFLVISLDINLAESKILIALSSSKMFPSEDDNVSKIFFSISFSCFLLAAD